MCSSHEKANSVLFIVSTTWGTTYWNTAFFFSKGTEQCNQETIYDTIWGEGGGDTRNTAETSEFFIPSKIQTETVPFSGMVKMYTCIRLTQEPLPFPEGQGWLAAQALLQVAVQAVSSPASGSEELCLLGSIQANQSKSMKTTKLWPELTILLFLLEVQMITFYQLLTSKTTERFTQRR